MPFVTIREIFTKVERFHDDFGRRLHDAESLATNREAKMMLQFLGNHQRELAKTLQSRESSNEIATLNEWVQFDTEVEDPRKFLRDFEVSADASA